MLRRLSCRYRGVIFAEDGRYGLTVLPEVGVVFFFFQAEDGIRDHCVTGVQTCALPIYHDVYRLARNRAVCEELRGRPKPAERSERGRDGGRRPGGFDRTRRRRRGSAEIGRASCRERV